MSSISPARVTPSWRDEWTALGTVTVTELHKAGTQSLRHRPGAADRDREAGKEHLPLLRVTGPGNPASLGEPSGHRLFQACCL